MNKDGSLTGYEGGRVRAGVILLLTAPLPHAFQPLIGHAANWTYQIHPTSSQRSPCTLQHTLKLF